MSETEHTGGCMCGAVRYAVRGEPLRVGICHCETCRRNTGAPFGVFAIFRRDQVDRLTGDTDFYQSSPTGRRHFCPRCGAPVFAEWSDSGDFDVPIGSLDAPERLAPTYELWTVRRLPWLSKLDRLERFERNRT